MVVPTFSILALPSGELSSLTVFSKKALLVAKRESSGMPLLYFPVSMPESRGDQMVLAASARRHEYAGPGAPRAPRPL
jgi:hypothetical protein